MTRPGTPPALTLVARGDAAGLEAALADPAVGGVVLHDGVELAPGALGRLGAELARPGRRLLRVLTSSNHCLVVDRHLLRRAVSALGAERVAADPPRLDHDLAALVDAEPAGQWRHWVDGEVVGVRTPGADRAAWESTVERRFSPAGQARTTARSWAGRARRALARRRDRRTAQPR